IRILSVVSDDRRNVYGRNCPVNRKSLGIHDTNPCDSWHPYLALRRKQGPGGSRAFLVFHTIVLVVDPAADTSLLAYQEIKYGLFLYLKDPDVGWNPDVVPKVFHPVEIALSLHNFSQDEPRKF